MSDQLNILGVEKSSTGKNWRKVTMQFWVTVTFLIEQKICGEQQKSLWPTVTYVATWLPD